MSQVRYVINAAKHSRYNAEHWYRYLRKFIFEDYSKLTENDVFELLKSGELTDFQKVTLKAAMQRKSPTHKYIISLNQKAKLKNFEAVQKKYGGL